MDDNNQIVFWGPRQSGKTWLFNAFIKKIQILNSHLSQEDSLQIEWKRNNNWSNVELGESLKIEPNSDLEQVEYRLLRKMMARGLLHEVNNHCNEILIADNTGGVFDGSKKDDPFAVEQAKQVVRNTRYLILSLNSGLQENAKQGAIVENLHELSNIIDRNSPSKYIAACLTKVDTLGGELVIEFYNRNKSELRSLLIRSFGAKYVDDIYKKIEQIKNGGSNQVVLFATSATGYYIQNGKKIKNLSSDEKSLANPSQWNPEEVEKPFFWLFSIMERERLKYLPNKRNLFQFFMGNKTIVDSRQDAYLDYETLVRIAQSRS